MEPLKEKCRPLFFDEWQKTLSSTRADLTATAPVSLPWGIDLTQYKRNPVLLYMHTRGFDGKSTPIGRVENIRVEGDELQGTPVFDMKDPFAAEIARKWEEDFIRMCSAGLEPVELSTATEYLLPGQSRATVVRSKLVEVSIADIGSNDDALQLYEPSGKILRLASGADSEIVPLLKKRTLPGGGACPGREQR